MKLSEDLLRQLLATFVTEAREHLTAANRHLLALEKQEAGCPDAQNLAELFREVHSLKGAARAVNQGGIETLSHALEAVFGQVKTGQLTLEPADFDLLCQALDGLTALVESAAAGENAQTDRPDLGSRLEALAQGVHAPPKTTTSPAAPLTAAAPNPASDAGRSQASQPPASQAAIEPRAAPNDTVRISIAKLDALMASVSELRGARSHASQHLAELGAILEDVDRWPTSIRGAGADAELVSQQAAIAGVANRLRAMYHTLELEGLRFSEVIRDLQDEVLHSRLQPAESIFEGFPRLVRDLSRSLGKDVELQMQGGETEVDRSALEQIKDPLVHLLRNAVDHGIEAPAARLAAGKPGQGQVTLSAASLGESLIIEVSDDGAGIDLERVKEKAVALGMVSAGQAQSMPDREAMELIFRPGLSASAQITEISGRGVGMDIVRNKVELLNGTIDVSSQRGGGTRVCLKLPLHVATTQCLFVRAGGQAWAIPVTNVLHITQLSLDRMGYIEGHPVTWLDGRAVAVLRLQHVCPTNAAATASDPGQLHTAIVLASGDRCAAFVVDALLGVEEVTVKHLPRPWARLSKVAGATILGSGEVVVVLKVPDLLRSAGEAAASLRASLAAAPDARAPQAPLIMVADDSITTRTLEKSILEGAGYRVETVADGLEAWQALQHGSYDLLVSDVNMPRLEGFDLARHIRADDRLKHLPIILVTSLNSEADRQQSIQAGADAFITKGTFDQASLLETVHRFI